MCRALFSFKWRAMTAKKSSLLTAMMALATGAIGWGMAPVFIRGISDAYDPYTQTLVRYGSATMLLIVISRSFYHEEFGAVLRQWKPIFAVSMLNVLQQCAWVNACYHAATMSQIITKLSVVFVIILSFYIFQEERNVIKSRLFLAGTLLSLLGVILVLCKDPGSLTPQLDLPTALALFVAVCWAGYSVWCKHIVTDCHPVPMFTLAAIYTTVAFGILSVVFGRPSTLIGAGIGVTAIAVVSGIICIAVSHPCYHYAQKRLGSAMCSSLLLLNPLVTYGLALLFWEDERLIATQGIGAGCLLAGSMLVVWAGRRARNGNN